jgi:IS5 family transposase
MGCTQGYKRNWSEYNDHLVRRGEIYIDLAWLEGWQAEVQAMNEGKRGRPFDYPETMMEFLACVRQVFRLPWRQMEGFLRGLFRVLRSLHDHLRAADYTTLWRRVAAKVVEVPVQLEEDVIIAVDSSGVKVTNRGEWLRRRGLLGLTRGWLKLHIAVDVRTKAILAVEVTDEGTGDAGMLPGLVEGAQAVVGGRVVKVLGDGGYDTMANFNFLDSRGVEAVIKVRKDASRRSRGSRARARAVREFQDMGYEAWKEEKEYGQRWACEVALSAFKRIFGEHVLARRRDLMVAEVLTKVALYNMMLMA